MMSKTTYKILITINHLKGFGGSEKYVLQLISGLCNADFTCYIHAKQKGKSFQKALDIGAIPWSDELVDCVIINHNTNIDIAQKFRGKVPMIMICHGIYPELEQPISNLSWYFGVSDEVTNRLQKHGLPTSTLRNPTPFEEFEDKEKTNDYLVLSQGTEAITALKSIIPQEASAIYANKHDNEIINIEDVARKSKVVVGSGRAIIEGVAAKCAVVLFESRHYDSLTHVGPVNLTNWRSASYTNYSGREMTQIEISNLADTLNNALNTSIEEKTKLFLEMRSFHHTNYVVNDLTRMISQVQSHSQKKHLFSRSLKILDLRNEREKLQWETPAR